MDGTSVHIDPQVPSDSTASSSRHGSIPDKHYIEVYQVLTTSQVTVVDPVRTTIPAAHYLR